ncbi:50S ribosomal protein L15 [Candidatus Gracilibacteria bacterium]|nr:50S ribosomal protein L15 [Candidatus Gracilibacteria bacterium]
MLTTNTISPNSGSKKSSKRVGRGNGSGKGTFSGRGMNGQNSRSGGGVPDWFEGGQTPLFRRMPKMRGFSNARFKKHFNVVNLSQIETIAKSGVTDITLETLIKHNIVSKKNLPVKLLGAGELTSKVTLTVDSASNSAQEAFKNAGGTLNLSTVESE